MNKIILDKLKLLTEICKAHHVKELFALAEKLENLFDRKVDLITVNSLSNPYFIKSLEKTKTELYAA